MSEILTTLVLMWSWFIVWLFVVFSQIYSYDVLYILGQCALRIDESENTYICTYMYVYMYLYVFTNIFMYYVCTYVSMYTCLYIHMGVLDIEQIPPNVPLHKLLFCFMKNGAGAT